METGAEIASEFCYYGGMDATPDKKDTPKLEELSHAQLVQLLRDALDRLKKANERIEILEKGLNDSLTPKLPVPYSVRSEEARKERKKRLDQKTRKRKSRFAPDGLKQKKRLPRQNGTRMSIQSVSIRVPARFRMSGLLFASKPVRLCG